MQRVEMEETYAIKLILGALSALSGVVVYLFNLVMNQNKEHKNLIIEQTKEQVRISKELGEVSGQQEGIKTLAREVIQTVHAAVAEKPSTTSEDSNFSKKN